MPAGVGGPFVVVLLVALAAPLVLWYLVRAERERDAANVTDRRSAERAARKDTESDGRRGRN